MKKLIILAALAALFVVSAVPARADINATPIGNNDGFEGVVPLDRCVSRGWAVDPDDRVADLSVRIFADGFEVATGTADVFRQDLIDAGVSPDGFSGWSIPLWDVLTFDEPHTISAQARDAQTLEWFDIGASKQLTCSPSANTTPIGNNDGFEGVVPLDWCVSRGWAVDPDDRVADLSVRIFADGFEVATGTADVFRQDLIDAGVSPDGFSGWSIPLWDVLTFDEPHTISAQARDAQTLEWFDIGASKQLTCVGDINPGPNPPPVPPGWELIEQYRTFPGTNPCTGADFTTFLHRRIYVLEHSDGSSTARMYGLEWAEGWSTNGWVHYETIQRLSPNDGFFRLRELVIPMFEDDGNGVIIGRHSVKLMILGDGTVVVDRNSGFEWSCSGSPT